ncbi:MAG: hypothetical protein GYA35_01840 [Thermoanaerobaculaceae bacterium]|nr:hypothetical protein [Thermoanaerobaculaceae bacterium]
MKKTRTELKVALLGKNQILEDELINEFRNLGIEEKNIISMDDQVSQITFDIEDEEARFYLPLESERLKGFDALFVLGGLSQSRVDFLDNLREKLKIFVIHSESRAEENFLKNRSGYFYIPSPEVMIISEILQNLKKQYPANFHWSLYESVSSKGKEGLKELFDQTRDVLNFQTPDKNVFKKQIAFSLILHKPNLSEEDENEIRNRSGYQGILYRNAIDVPLFYGTHIVFFANFINWEEKTRKEIETIFKKSDFFEYKKDLSDLANKDESKPSLFIDTEKEKCLFGIVYYDTFKMTVKTAILKLKNGE